jgi:hypothetical protein
VNPAIDRMRQIIRGAKGGKDRVVALPLSGARFGGASRRSEWTLE